MADQAKMELTTRSIMNADLISPTLNISIRNGRSRRYTGTAIRDFFFQGIRKTRSCIPLSRSKKPFYSERYDEFCEAQHKCNKQTGHSNRDRSTEDLWKDKKTSPEESLFQIGTMEQSFSPTVLALIAAISLRI